jgi:hypothetical protein
MASAWYLDSPEPRKSSELKSDQSVRASWKITVKFLGNFGPLTVRRDPSETEIEVSNLENN